ncbi:hypothetical protein DM01DRAFT_1392176 [Hesseltinella vesiculosa]|uniref:DUF1765-domain-containing protein n=1 Tax=Hesseltinella vesiculosa TaxID=101127 RepID=A0A1X2GVK7_9FUNG|nr:hypothetical protein DM01DRAFT_1392176 [Hesseltinella vesiculosa]
MEASMIATNESYLSLFKLFQRFKRQERKRYELLVKKLYPLLKAHSPTDIDQQTGIKHTPTPATPSIWDKMRGYSEPKGATDLIYLIRELLLDWWDKLLETVPFVASNEKSVYYDCICMIMTRVFPNHLHSLIGATGWDYEKYVRKIAIDIEDRASPWMARWIEFHGELFLIFFRHFHTALTTYLWQICPEAQHEKIKFRDTMLAHSPGYLYFCGHFLRCIHNMINGMVHSLPMETPDDAVDSLVSLSSTQVQKPDSQTTPDKRKINQPPSFHSSLLDDTGSYIIVNDNDVVFGQQHVGKPMLLDKLNWKYAKCLAWIAMMVEPCGRFHNMVNIMCRALTTTIDVGNDSGVFGLFDFLEATLLQCQHNRLMTEYHPPYDHPFILHTIHIVFAYADHTSSLLRALSYVYSHFSFLTTRSSLLDMLCNRILLEPAIFERLFLHWSKHVRSFFAQLLVYRVGVIWPGARVAWKPDSSAKPEIPSLCRGLCNQEPIDELWEHTQDFDLSPDAFIRMERTLRKHTTIVIHRVLETMYKSFHGQCEKYERIHLTKTHHYEGFSKPKPVVPYCMFPPQLSDSTTSMYLSLTSSKNIDLCSLAFSTYKESLYQPASSSIHRRRSFGSAFSTLSSTTAYSDDDTTLQRWASDDHGFMENAYDVYKNGYVLWFQYYAVPRPIIDPFIATAPTQQLPLRSSETQWPSKEVLDKFEPCSNNAVLLRGYGRTSDIDRQRHYRTLADAPNRQLTVERTLKAASDWQYSSCHHVYALEQQKEMIALHDASTANSPLPKLVLVWPVHWVVHGDVK